jgi:transposase
VELLPAVQVRAFVRSHKDDAADARAIWLAAQQSDIRRVPQKSVEQQAVLSLHRTRQHWVSVRTASVNSLRGLLYEFGVVLRGGRQAGLKALAEQRAVIDEQLPATMRTLVDGQLQTLEQIGQRIEQLEREIAALQKQLKGARELDRVPGIGVLGCTALAATLGDGKAWRSGREFSASLGLVPAHAGTGGKVRVGHLSKRGDPYLRTLLIHGARSVIEHAKDKPKWLQDLLARRPLNVAVVALANKMARTAWAIVAHGRTYQRDWKSTRPGSKSEPAQAVPA